MNIIKRMKIILTGILVFTVTHLLAHEEKFYYLEGTIGNRGIVMKIELFDELWFAKYFYKDQKKDILLRGSCDSTSCNLSVTRWDAKKNKELKMETFKLTEKSDHSWVGEWIDATKKSFPVLLRPFTKDSIKHTYAYSSLIEEIDPYSYYRTADLKFMKIRSEKFGEYNVEWMKESLSGITFFRLADGFFPDEIKKTNRVLEAYHLRDIENYFSCSSIGHSGKLSSTTTITFLSNDLLSFTKAVTSNCYAVQPLTDTKAVTMAVKTGEVLDLENIFWMRSGLPPKAETQEWYEYRYNTFGTVMHKLLLEIYPDKMQQEKCNYDDPQAWQFPFWYLTPSGLFLGAFFPGIDRSCDNTSWAIIPYGYLKSYKNPGFSLPGDNN